MTILFGSTVESVAAKGDGLEVKLLHAGRGFFRTRYSSPRAVLQIREGLGLETAGVARFS